MSTRLVAWLQERKDAPPGIHFRGLPPALTGGQDRREQLAYPRVLLIEEKNSGIFLFRFTGEGDCVGDTWHASIDDAKYQAEYEYGDSLGEWASVPPEIDDPVAFALMGR